MFINEYDTGAQMFILFYFTRHFSAAYHVAGILPLHKQTLFTV
jgi:hypothetical protein